MAGHSRHRVTIELLGAEERLRRFAEARQTTVAALVRQAVLAMLDANPDIDGGPMAISTAGADDAVVKTTIRLSAARAQKLAIAARQALVSQGAYVAGLIDGAPPSVDHSEMLTAISRSTARLAALSVDLNAIARQMRRGIVVDTGRHRADLTTLSESVQQHVVLAAQFIAQARATWRARGMNSGKSPRKQT